MEATRAPKQYDRYRVGRLEDSNPADYAMTFEQIGQQLGVSASGAWMIYASAMVKLRRRREAFRHLLTIHHEMEIRRQERGNFAEKES